MMAIICNDGYHAKREEAGLARYDAQHKDGTRRRIVERASLRFRRDGVAGAGVAGLMADAGLTHGGFYAHFASKEDLLRAAIVEAFDAAMERHRQRAASGEDPLEAIVRGYLRPQHRDEPERGCPAAALGPEIARHPDDTRRVFAAKIDQLVDVIAAYVPGRDAAARRRAARSVFALLMGTLQLARVEPDPAAAARILADGVSAALALARPAGAPRAPRRR